MLSAKSIVVWQRSCMEPVEALRTSEFVAYRNDFENHREAVKNARSMTSRDLELSSSTMRSLNATLRRTKEYKRAATADAVRKENTRLVSRLLEIQKRSDLRQSILREGGAFSGIVPGAAFDECTASSRPTTQGYDGGAPASSGTLNLPWRRRVMDGINKDNAWLYERLRQAGPRVQAVPALRKAYKLHVEQVARIRRFRPRRPEAWSTSSSSGPLKGTGRSLQQPGRKQGCGSEAARAAGEQGGQQQEQQQPQQPKPAGGGEGSSGSNLAAEPGAPSGEKKAPGEGGPLLEGQEGANCDDDAVMLHCDVMGRSPEELAMMLPHMVGDGSNGGAAGGMLRPDTAPAGSSRPGTGQRHPPGAGAAAATVSGVEVATQDDGPTGGGVAAAVAVAVAAGARPMTTFAADDHAALAANAPRPMTTFSADDRGATARTPGNARGDAQEPLFPPGPPVGEEEAAGYSDDDFDDDFDPESDDQSDGQERDLGVPCRSELEWEAEEAAAEAAQSNYSEEGDSTPEQGARGGGLASPGEGECVEESDCPTDDFEEEADIPAEEDDDEVEVRSPKRKKEATQLSNLSRTPPGEALEETTSSPEPSD